MKDLIYNHDERIERYERFELLRLGKHEQAFNQYIRQIGSVYRRDVNQGYPSMFYTINIAREISRISADLLFDEEPKIKADEPHQQEWIDHVIEYLDIHKIFYESVDFGSVKGDSVFRILLSDEEITVSPVNPALYYPEIHQLNITKPPEKESLKQEVKLEIGRQEERAILETIYEGNSISYLLYSKDGERQYNVQTYFPDLQDTQVDMDERSKLIFHVKNSGVPTEFWGESDYNDLEGLFYSINNRFSRINSILDKHSSPVLKMDQKAVEQIVKGGGKLPDVVGVSAGLSSENNPTDMEYIVWDGKLQDSFEQLSQAIDTTLMLAEISPSLVGRDTSGGVAESGRALKFRLIRTLAMKHRKEMYWGRFITQLFWSLQDISYRNNWGIGGKVSGEPRKVSIEWQDGLLNDNLEKIEIIERELANGLISKAEAIAKFNNIDKDIAEERLSKINEEKNQASIFFDPTQPTVEEE